MRIAVFFIGELHDAGFNASALAGVGNMLNGARQGAIDACRSFGVRQMTAIRGF